MSAVALPRLHVCLNRAQRGSKGKGHLRTGHERPEGECRYDSTLFLTSGPDRGGVVNTTPSPPSLPRERDRVPIVQEPEWATGRV